MPAKRRAVIFGLSGFAEVVDFYLTNDSDYEVAAFTASGETLEGTSEFRDRPVVAFEEIERRYPPDDVELFIAVGYRQMNKIRQRLIGEAQAKGYGLLSYVCSKCSHWGESEGGAQIGANVFVFEDNTLQPFVSIGDGTILWSGNHIGHHTTIGRCCFVSSHVVISGHCTIGDRCFFGVNATVGDAVRIGNDNLIGARALIEKETGDGEVYLEKRTPLFPRPSDRFLR